MIKQPTPTTQPIETLDSKSADFPEALQALGTDCPQAIYIKGTKDALTSGNHVAIIGAKDATAEECELARQLGRLFSSDIVVSGLARGIDTAAHQGCMEAGGVSVAIVATGLDRTYPRENADLELVILQNGGMIVSEYPEGTKANPTRLIARTRLQMAIADKVIVVACEKKSGTMHAAEWAVKLGKPIFAIDNARTGNRHLIDSGMAIAISLQASL
ncbi:MAG: DNA-protecting protein DprA [Muribaculaceae bacterium]|nr:DNA-protecting protein DprA [Muribaculaceae bacterium]